MYAQSNFSDNTPIDGGKIKLETETLDGAIIEVVNKRRVLGFCDDVKERTDLFVTTSMVFVDKNGKKIDLVKFCPARTFLIRGFYNKGFCEFGNSLKKFDDVSIAYSFILSDFNDKLSSLVGYNNLISPGELMVLLHEIGHVVFRDSFVLKRLELMTFLGVEQRKAQEEKRTFAKNGEILILLSDEGGVDVPTPVSIKHYVNLNLLRANEERLAWSFALAKLRELRKQGFLFEPRLDTVDKINHIVHDTSLGTYEEEISKRVVCRCEYEKLLKGIYEKR